MKDTLSKEEIRVIKLGREALFELIYETLIERQKDDFQVDPLEVINTFEIDWEKGEFIFCVHKAEDEKGNILPFPKGIDCKKLIEYLPNTTHSIYSASKHYSQYTKKELLEICNNIEREK